MKKIILSLAAVAALSAPAFAERKWDLRDTPTAQGTIDTGYIAASSSTAVPLSVLQPVEVLAGSPNDIYDAHGFKR
jgi:hypothetical protein